MIEVTPTTYPALCAAFRAIDEDSGRHLIGTVYPGEKTDLDRYEVPDAWATLVTPAEVGLQRLKQTTPDDFETFVIGEYSEQRALRERQGDLQEAYALLADFFNGWQPEDAPTGG